MRLQLLQAGRCVSALFASADAGHEQIDEPHQAVLIHWLDICQVRYAEEQDLARVSNRGVPPTNLIGMRTGGGGEGGGIYDAAQKPKHTEYSGIENITIPSESCKVLHNVCFVKQVDCTNKEGTQRGLEGQQRIRPHLVNVLLGLLCDKLLFLDIVRETLMMVHTKHGGGNPERESHGARTSRTDRLNASTVVSTLPDQPLCHFANLLLRYV